MSLVVRELITELGFRVDEKTLDKYEAKLEATAKKANQLGRNMTLFVSTPLIALGTGLIKMASDAEETTSKFNTVFRDIGDQAKQASDELVRSYGLSRKASKELLGDTGDLLSGFGFTQESALDLSRQVQRLSVDLASFTNYSGGAKGASQALTKALLGERESVKQLGIAILEEDVKAKVAEMRARGMTFETERQAKAYATLEIALSQSKNAIGDYARTQDQLANRMRQFQGRLADLAVSFGKLLLPLANKLVGVGLKLIDKFEALNDTTKELILIFGGLAIVAGPLIFIFSKILFLIKGMTIATLGWTAVIVAVVTALALLIQDIKVWAEGGDSLLGRYLGSWENFKDGLMRIFEGIKAIVLGAWDIIVDTFAPTVEILLSMAGSILQVFGGIFKIIGGIFRGDLRMIGQGIKDALGGILAFVGNWVRLFIDGLIRPFRFLFSLLGNMKDLVGKAGGIKNILGNVGGFLGGAGEVATSLGTTARETDVVGALTSPRGGDTINNTEVGPSSVTVSVDTGGGPADAQEIAEAVVNRQNEIAKSQAPIREEVIL